MGTGRERPDRVAVIDVGSNSIKLLVARGGERGAVVSEKYATIDARLGQGITAAKPVLGESAQVGALAAISSLLQQAQVSSAMEIALVATSAVRDAVNGPAFAQRVRAATGITLQILSGDEEANLIGRGLLCDPAVAAHNDFEVFDLGGGSLECLAFQQRQVAGAVSLPLGCVRLTEKFVRDPRVPLSGEESGAIRDQVSASLRESGFHFGSGSDRLVFGTGGTLTTLRAMRAARLGQPFEQSDSEVTAEEISAELEHVGQLPLTERQKIGGLPPARADVFPAALVTLATICEVGYFRSFHTSVYNLRFGVAAKMLGTVIASSVQLSVDSPEG